VKAILDIQHKGKPGKNDLGASHDLDGDGVIEAFEHEANLTPIYADAARRLLEQAGVEVVLLERGAYSTRHKRAAELADGHPGRVAYVACHLNAGGGDYGLVCHDYRSSAGNTLATSIRLALLKRGRPELRRVLTGATAPTERPTNERHGEAWDRLPRVGGALYWPRPFSTISGIYAGPANLSGVCFEPCFLDSPIHAPLVTEQGLERLGHALASGLLAWLVGRR
jgi:hypothetical protein